MSHATGIAVPPELVEAFKLATSRGGTTRALTITIEGLDKGQTASGEHVTLKDTIAAGASWQSDMGKIVQALPDRLPLYVLLKRDDTWTFVTYVPDTSPVRHKMVYAATAATLKKAGLGASVFGDDYRATTKVGSARHLL